MKSKNLIIIGLLILFLVVIINESRFIFWGAFGVPERPNSMNCGEERYNFNVKINSKSDFLNFIESLKNLKDGDGGFRISQWARERNYTSNDIEVRNSMSLFFSQKLYSVPSCGGSMTFEISETGYASARGCCGI